MRCKPGRYTAKNDGTKSCGVVKGRMPSDFYGTFEWKISLMQFTDETRILEGKMILERSKTEKEVFEAYPSSVSKR